MAWETDGNATDALFNEATACAMLCSRPRLPGAVDAVFETGQLFGADRAAGVKLTRSDSDFRAVHGRVCPVPWTRYLKLVSCSAPTGPRA